MGLGDHPATGMTQWAALQYARWLSLKSGRLYRLPTEAEWEYACRAGTTTTFPFGDSSDPIGDHAWFAANSGDVFHRVGQKGPNAWGVHDLLGNVAEWTMDQYAAAAYEKWSDEPWTRPTSEHPRTVRGGAFDDDPSALRCADRLESTLRWNRRDPQLPKSRWWNTDSPHVGFRLVSPDRSFSIEEIRSYWDDMLGS
jgi:formylglycine-generating enzyme required for sulfatase activity